MNPTFKIPLLIGIVALILCGGAAYLQSQPAENLVTFTLTTVQKEGSADAPVSEIILQGSGKDVLFSDVIVGSGAGCTITEKEKFQFPENSLSEVYCYFAGSGQLFQLRKTDAENIDVVHFLVTENIDYETKSYNIYITDASIVYTFKLSGEQRVTF